jgi:hypothetical protein
VFYHAAEAVDKLLAGGEAAELFKEIIADRMLTFNMLPF